MFNSHVEWSDVISPSSACPQLPYRSACWDFWKWEIINLKSDFVDAQFSYYGALLALSAFMCFYPLLPTFLSRRSVNDVFQTPVQLPRPPHPPPSQHDSLHHFPSTMLKVKEVDEIVPLTIRCMTTPRALYGIAKAEQNLHVLKVLEWDASCSCKCGWMYQKLVHGSNSGRWFPVFTRKDKMSIWNIASQGTCEWRWRNRRNEIPPACFYFERLGVSPYCSSWMNKLLAIIDCLCVVKNLLPRKESMLGNSKKKVIILS